MTLEALSHGLLTYTDHLQPMVFVLPPWSKPQGLHFAFFRRCNLCFFKNRRSEQNFSFYFFHLLCKKNSFFNRCGRIFFHPLCDSISVESVRQESVRQEKLCKKKSLLLFCQRDRGHFHVLVESIRRRKR